MLASGTCTKGCSCTTLPPSPQRFLPAHVAFRGQYSTEKLTRDHRAAHAASGPIACEHPPTRAQHQGDSTPRQARVKHNTWLNKGGADARGSPFHELRLHGAPLAQVPIKRRNYTLLNKPTAEQLLDKQQAAAAEQQQKPNWAQAYADPHQPLAVDVGCGAGRFLLLLARKDAECRRNYLGMDIQPALVTRGNAWAAHLGLADRVQYLKADAAAQLQQLLDSYPGPLELVTVQFPDPQNHRDRCAMQPALVHSLRQTLAPGGVVLLQTEDETTALYMRQLFWDHGQGMFQPSEQHHTAQASGSPDALEARFVAHGAAHLHHAPDGANTAAVSTACAHNAAVSEAATQDCVPGSVDMPWASAGWLATNPLGVPTERELFVESVRAGQERVYRLLLRKR